MEVTLTSYFKKIHLFAFPKPISSTYIIIKMAIYFTVNINDHIDYYYFIMVTNYIMAINYIKATSSYINFKAHFVKVMDKEIIIILAAVLFYLNWAFEALS